MKLLVGLGNPGIKYQDTRHNIGFAVLEAIIEKEEGDWGNEAKANALVSRYKTHNEEVVVIALPQSYMNLSGEVVVELLRWFKLKKNDLIVVHDDLDLSFSKIQIKRDGGDAGHNGIRSIIERIGPEFIRVRIGIGRPEKSSMVEKYVLDKFTDDQMHDLPDVIERTAEKIDLLLKYGYDEFMSKYNS